MLCNHKNERRPGAVSKWGRMVLQSSFFKWPHTRVYSSGRCCSYYSPWPTTWPSHWSPGVEASSERPVSIPRRLGPKRPYPLHLFLGHFVSTVMSHRPVSVCRCPVVLLKLPPEGRRRLFPDVILPLRRACSITLMRKRGVHISKSSSNFNISPPWDIRRLLLGSRSKQVCHSAIAWVCLILWDNWVLHYCTIKLFS